MKKEWGYFLLFAVLTGAVIYFYLPTLLLTGIGDFPIPKSEKRCFSDRNKSVRGYYNDGENISFDGYCLDADADLPTFVVISNNDPAGCRYYAKDKNHVFYYNEILDADPDSFTQIKTPSGECSPFSKDSGVVFYLNDQLPNFVDPQTFSVFDIEVFAKDRAHIYSGSVAINEADLATFEPLNYRYSKDKNNVYVTSRQTLETEVLVGADPISFQVIFEDEAQDKNRKYFGWPPE